MGKHTALLLCAPFGTMRSMTRLPLGRRTLGAPIAAGAAVASPRRRRRRFPLLRMGRRGLARGGGWSTRATSDGCGSIAQERDAQQRLFGGRSSGFASRELPQSAFSLFFLSMNPHGSSLLHLLDALATHGLVIDDGPAHLGQPSVDGRRQWRITWPTI